MFAISLTGCVSFIANPEQNIAVTTLPVQGAQCSLENNKGKWFISKTPGSVMVRKSDRNLIIICEKNGYAKTVSEIKPETNNTLYGKNLPSMAIDNNGLAFRYPMSVRILLTP